MFLRVHVENAEVDDDGETTWLGVVELTPETLIDAIGAWESGDHYTPASIQP